MKKLHLGCGQRYLDGYINIDFPLSEHSVQLESVADEHHDITELHYQKNSIAEVRLHHVFEHFERPMACALVASWNSWLMENGTLHIEVPDFEKTAKAALSRFKNTNQKKVAIRHLFGSHEAEWAVHAEGYSRWLLGDLLETFGFKIVKILTNSWRGTYNIELIAQKEKDIAYEQCDDMAAKYLEGFLLDESEKPMLDIWLRLFQEQLQVCFAK